MTNVMIDIETMGHTVDAPILSLAALSFDFNGNLFDSYYKVIDLESSMALGSKPSASTIYWWMLQSWDARKAITHDKEPVLDVLKGLNYFLKELQPKKKSLNIWANSPSFDLAIIKRHYSLVGLKEYWMWYRELDVRTVASFYPQIKKDAVDENGVAHNALEDCKLQVKYLTDCIKIMKNEKI